MATGGHSQPDFPVRMRQKPSPSPFREFSPGARPMSQQEDSLFSSANGRERSQTIGPSITSPSLFLRSKSLRSFKSKKHSDSAIHMDRPNSGPLESIQHTDDSEGMPVLCVWRLLLSNPRVCETCRVVLASKILEMGT